jgi:pilus assembly protein FimV
MNGATRHLITRLSIVGLGLLPMIAFALGIGDIQVESRLNQPLRARIEVADVTDEEWHQIHARIHQEASLDHDVIHSELLGSIAVRAVDLDHRHFIEMRTSEPITEPLFDLPVELASSKSRLIRSYAILLDPPGAEDAAPAAQTVSPSPEIKPTVRTRTEDAVPETRPDEPHRAASSRAGGKRHPHRSERIETNRPSPTSVSASTSAPASRLAPASTPAQASRSAPTSTTAAAAAASAVQEELKVQLEQLQQTLARMQETISAQNDQIVQLSAKMSAQGRFANERTASAERSAGSPAARSTDSESADDTSSQADEVDDGDSSGASNTRGPYYWVAAALTMAALVLGALLLRRKLRGPAANPPERPTVELSEPPKAFFRSGADRLQVADPPPLRTPLRPVAVAEPRRTPPSAPAPVAGSAPDRMAALASSFRLTSSGWASQAAANSETKVRAPARPVGETRPVSPPPAAVEPTERLPAAKMPPLTEAPADTEGLPEEYLEELPAAYIAKMPGVSGTDLDLDVTLPMSALESLVQEASGESPVSTATPPGGGDPPDSPQVSHAKEAAAADARAAAGATEQARSLAEEDGRSLVNKEVAQILEKSLGNDPNRVDIRLKLLEIYHHEARGNRAEFNSLVRNLIADPRALTPAQRQHVEKLQRTLGEEPADPAGEFVSKVAI